MTEFPAKSLPGGSKIVTVPLLPESMPEALLAALPEAAPPPRGNRILGAAARVLAGMFIIGFIDNFVVVIARDGGVWQFHLIRGGMAVLLIILSARLVRWPLRVGRVWAVALRSLFNSLAMLIYFGALAFLPIGQVVAGLFTAPIFVLLISAAVFGARIGPWRILAVAVGFAGILMILHPDAGTLSWLTLMPVLAGFFYAAGNVATREWCRGESTAALLLWFFALMAVWGALGLGILATWPQVVPEGAAGFLLRGWVVPGSSFLFWTFVQAVGSVVSVWLIIRGYQMAEASHVAVFENTLLVFAALWGFVLWGQTVAPLAIGGMAAIAVAGAIIALRAR